MVGKNLNATLNAKGTVVRIFSNGANDDYISLTDIAKYKSEDPSAVIQNWIRNRDTIEFIGLWEQMNNPNFNPLEFEGFRKQSGANAFVLSPKKWIESTNAIGIVSKSGRYGGTFAHKDIAFEFASWISAEFKLYIITDYQRLKLDENSRLSLDWNAKRALSKINYKIHTDAIKENLIPEDLPVKYQGITYANEADMLNVALWGRTAKEWREENKGIKGNIRDYATVQELIVMINLENLNAEFINQGISQSERLTRLHSIALRQLKALNANPSVKKLE